MSFVRLENLNDFIQPSTTCVKPVEKRAPGTVAKVKDINLSDCLACSGCITSAESVLVQQQNYDELFKIINECKTAMSKKEIVASLSLQSIASLAYKYSMSAQETAERLASFLISLGFSRVFDINIARHLSLVESYREFKSRSKSQTNFPLISSICPGFICYAEKTNGDLVIPHLSKVRSPQQIMGSILKHSFPSYCSMDGVGIYHVTIMPCFDKKLEASRQDFKNPIDEAQDVDCVLTPVELEEILVSEGVSLRDFDRRALDTLAHTGCKFDSPLTSHLGSTSGGYAEHILLSEARALHAHKWDDSKIGVEYSTLKNSDFIELNLRRNDTDGDTNERLPKVAIVNGFRNIQTVVQRLKRKALKYDYIEVMACPSGCINGGAQCRPNDGDDQVKTIESTIKIYKEVPIIEMRIDSDVDSDDIYKKLGLEDDGRVDQLLYTSFHPVPKMQNLTVNW